MIETYEKLAEQHKTIMNSVINYSNLDQHGFELCKCTLLNRSKTLHQINNQSTILTTKTWSETEQKGEEKKWILRILKQARDWGSTKDVVKFIHSVQKKHMSLYHVIQH